MHIENYDMKNNIEYSSKTQINRLLEVLARKKWLFSVATLSTAVFSTVVNAEAVNPLLGNWGWVTSDNSCIETYLFDEDHLVQITSGDEISDAEYHLSDQLTERGFYTLTLKILKDKGGKDCADNLEDNTGQTYHKYVMFHPSGEQYVSCDKETIEECAGPLRKIQ